MEALPTVITAYGISLGVANMIIRGYEDADRVRDYTDQQRSLRMARSTHIPGKPGIVDY